AAHDTRPDGKMGYARAERAHFARAFDPGRFRCTRLRQAVRRDEFAAIQSRRAQAHQNLARARLRNGNLARFDLGARSLGFDPPGAHQAASRTSDSPGFTRVNATGFIEISSASPESRALVNADCSSAPLSGKSSRKCAPRESLRVA